MTDLEIEALADKCIQRMKVPDYAVAAWRSEMIKLFKETADMGFPDSVVTMLADRATDHCVRKWRLDVNDQQPTAH